MLEILMVSSPAEGLRRALGWAEPFVLAAWGRLVVESGGRWRILVHSVDMVARKYILMGKV